MSMRDTIDNQTVANGVYVATSNLIYNCNTKDKIVGNTEGVC
jgi:hypothetical protein